MSADEIREIIRQELAAFFATPVVRTESDEPISPMRAMQIRSAARTELAAALERKHNRKKVA
jgi:hypothetical protein